MADEQLTVEQLDEQLMELGLKRSAITEEMRQLRRIRDQLFLIEEAQHRVASMSDAEKAALTQAISMPPIESAEAVSSIN